jgi:CubicO group peptidase (beta-lactamase class C family)
MRRRWLLIVAFLMVARSAAWAQSQSDALPTSPLVLDRFGAYLDSLRLQAGIPGLSAALVGTNGILWEQAYGQQNITQAIATRTDTPFQLDGLTQVFTASLLLRCVEEGYITLDDQLARHDPTSLEPGATIRQVLSHTSGPPLGLVFSYNPSRVDALAPVFKDCNGDSLRHAVAAQLDQLAMIGSVPGADAIQLGPPPGGSLKSTGRGATGSTGMFDQGHIDRFTAVLARLATPYRVDDQGNASSSQYTMPTLSPSAGLISSVDDLAQYVLALTSGVLLQPQTLALAWTPPAGADGNPLPHGLGWFVQSYNGETIVWQFGGSDDGSSSMVVMIPGRGLTLILMANSKGLVSLFPLAAGDLTVSPFGRLFLGLFVR